jgi:hypothetical protein
MAKTKPTVKVTATEPRKPGAKSGPVKNPRQEFLRMIGKAGLTTKK